MVAVPESEEGNSPGVVLRIKNENGPRWMRVPSPNVYDESEVLIMGVVFGADVKLGRGRWMPGLFS